MSEELELISDGDGLLILGKPMEIEQFLEAEGLQPAGRPSGRLHAAIGGVSAFVETAQAGAEVAERWVKVGHDVVDLASKYGLLDSKTKGLKHAVIGKPGGVKEWIKVVASPSSVASNPAAMTGVGGVMATMAIEQLVADITEYLAVIDKKLDKVLRHQTNEVLARMDGVEFLLREAATVRESVGRVSDVTWSKMQHSSAVVLETQAFALRQLNAVAGDLERESNVANLADVSADAEAETQKWLSVLARCVQLHDSIAVIELGRVMDTSPEELEQHLVGLRVARQQRVELFAEATGTLLQRMSAAAERANSKVLFNPTKSPAIIRSANEIGRQTHEFHELMSMNSAQQSAEARRWLDAASESWGTIRAGGAEGLGTVKHLSAGTARQAKDVKDKLAGKVAGRLGRKTDE